MTTTDRFPDLESVRALRLALKTERDLRLEDLKTHWEHVKDKSYRRALLVDAVKDLFTKDKDGSQDAPGTSNLLVQGVKMASGWLPLVGPLLGGRKGLLGSRLFWSGLSLALPIVANKGVSGALSGIWGAAQSGLRTVKGLFHQNGVSKERE